MKNLVLILVLVLLIPFIGWSQKGSFRVITKQLDTVFGSKLKQTNNGEIVYIEKANGESVRYGDVVSIREEIENWDYFNWTTSGFTDFVVVEIDSMSQQELFNTTLNWIKDNYENPDEVIKTTIDNSKIRMEGYGRDIIKYKGISVVDIPGKYVIEISFKDGKYKFDPFEVSYILDYPIGEVGILISDPSYYYNNRRGVIKKSYQYFPISVEKLFNDLNSSLFNFIISNKGGSSDNEDW